MNEIIERPEGSPSPIRVRTMPVGDSRTEQSHKSVVNVNTIMAKYKKTGLFPQRTTVPTYGDFTGYDDFHQTQNRVAEARSNFMTLPARIRKMFDNDPGKLLEFVLDADNRSEAIEMGLLPNDTPKDENGDSETPETPESPPE